MNERSVEIFGRRRRNSVTRETAGAQNFAGVSDMIDEAALVR
ncbi:hypothetical protein [Bradyrhizobium genosp. P]